MGQGSSAAFDRLPHAVVILRDGVITLANQRARQLLAAGAPPEPRPDGWPEGERLTEVARFLDDVGAVVEPPSTPPTVGDRYAERILHLAVPGGSRALAVDGCWSDGELVLTLRSAGRREAAVRQQGDVVATVAHEIRSPLTSVKGFTRTLLSRWERFSDEQKRTMLATIEHDADRVTRLLTDLLDVSRIDAGRVRLHRSTVDLQALATAVADRARMRDTGPVIEVVVASEVPTVAADRDKLEQVLTNLVDNALQHAPGTPVTITIGRLDAAVRISVADQGPGVDPGTAAQLFRKFGRGSSDHGAGTGLGLFLARGLVEAHGGRIWFDPEATDGAVVHVDLPTTPP